MRRERKVADGKGQKRKNLVLSTQDLLDLIKTHLKTVLPVVLLLRKAKEKDRFLYSKFYNFDFVTQSSIVL